MGVEGDDAAGETACAGLVQHAGDEHLVAAVDTIEDTDGESVLDWRHARS